MQGTQSQDVYVLYRGILDYYTSLSGLVITADDLAKRDKFVSDGTIVCDSSLDAALLEYQDKYSLADGNTAAQVAIIEAVINLLTS